MKHDQVLNLIRVAGYNNDPQQAMRLYTENRVSYLNYQKAWDEGVKTREDEELKKKFEPTIFPNQSQMEALKNMFGGKEWAFCGTSRGLGIAVRDEFGYHDLSFWYEDERMDKNIELAHQLNINELGIDQDTETAIIGSTMMEVM